MPLQFTVSPDFNAGRIPSWFLFNSRLQAILGEACHLNLYDSFDQVRDAILDDSIDIIHANAFDTAVLIRKKGFIPVVRGNGPSDEALIAVAASSPFKSVLDFKPGLNVAATEAPDIEMIGRILLEPAGLGRGDINILPSGNYVLVAKNLITAKAEAGFFLKESFSELSDLVRGDLRIVAESHIYVVRHALLISPRIADMAERISQGLCDSTDEALNQSLGIGSRWTSMSREDADFMIDLMDTLV